MKNSDISIHLTPDLRLEQAIERAGVKTPASITKLTVTGTITISDFKYIEKTMRNTLQELDLGNALVKSSKFLGPSNFLSGLISTTIPVAVCHFRKFTNISAHTSITAHPDDPLFSTQEGVLFNKNKSKLLGYPSGRKGECTVPDSVTLISECAFWCCSGLTSVTIPDSVVNIGVMAFAMCSGLTSITIPASVVNIGEWAFDRCTGLTSITIPASVVNIGESAFDRCSTFVTVHPDNPVYESVEGEIRRKQKSKE